MVADAPAGVQLDDFDAAGESGKGFLAVAAAEAVGEIVPDLF